MSDLFVVGLLYMVWASVEHPHARTTWDKVAVLVMRLVGIACVVSSILMGSE